MNLALWTAIREYIAAEIRLERARQATPAHWTSNKEHVAKREAESTKYEQIVRELIECPAQETGTAPLCCPVHVMNWQGDCPQCNRTLAALNRGTEHG